MNMNSCKSHLKYFLCSRIFSVSMALTLLVLIVANSGEVAHAREYPVKVSSASEYDVSLRERLLANDLGGFKRFLDQGAEPLEWLDDSQYGWVLCASTERGKEGFLEVLIGRGYDVNHRQSNIGSAISLPINCAIRFRNLEAIRLLMEAGADPSLSTCPTCRIKEYPTSLSLSVMVRKYEIAVYLLDKSQYPEEELESIVSMLESSPVNEASKWNDYRLELAELLRQRGYEVTPWTRNKEVE